jgi:hypothetical protein
VHASGLSRKPFRDDINRDPVIHPWTDKMAEAAGQESIQWKRRTDNSAPVFVVAPASRHRTTRSDDAVNCYGNSHFTKISGMKNA